MPFYAVRVGRQPGIYKTWAECLEQTGGFSGARFAKFASIEEAQDFMQPSGLERAAKRKREVIDTARERAKLQGTRTVVKTPGLATRPSTTRPMSTLPSTTCDETQSLPTKATPRRNYPRPRPVNDPSHNIFYLESDGRPRPNVLVVYTDGACLDNGRRGARAGYGVHVPSRPDLDEHGSLSAHSRPTNQRAELTAILRAIERTAAEPVPLEIRTDSMYSINCLTTWYRAWERDDWKVDKKNLDLIQEIVAAGRQRPHPIFLVLSAILSSVQFLCSDTSGDTRARLATSGLMRWPSWA